MKTFYEWLEVNEANLFSDWFGKKKQLVQTTPAPAPAPEKKGVNLDDFRRALDGPNYDPARYVPAQQNKQQQAQEAKPVTKAEAQPQLSSSPKTPEDYLEEVANKYWQNEEYLKSQWNKYKQSKKVDDLYLLYHQLAIGLWSGAEVEASKKAMIEILEEKFSWEAFPSADEAKIGMERGQIKPDDASALDGTKPLVGETVKVLAKGFMDRRGNIMGEAVVLRRQKNGEYGTRAMPHAR